MKDIETKEDITILVESFYQELLQDDLVSDFFTKVVVLDLETHIPVIADFWSSVLLSDGSYRGNVMMKHIELNQKKKMEPQHFDRWLSTWIKHVDKLYKGDKAEEAKQKAILMMELMKYKVAHSSDRGFIQ